ncbi:MAG TPA: SDR family oxidoreductase, partial [Nocardioides sp.]|nr:SDR family oxidoreductase [Nocardioides sp.]
RAGRTPGGAAGAACRAADVGPDGTFELGVRRDVAAVVVALAPVERRELGVQFARDGVRVNALCPGPVNTPLLQELFAKDPERAARRLVHIPMGRFGEPDEMASAVLFLASDDSSFMTANTFLVDGGISGAYVTPL